ncbi:MAG: hypothetical protein R3C05_23450 [Pirellulaceae bacterium]
MRSSGQDVIHRVASVHSEYLNDPDQKTTRIAARTDLRGHLEHDLPTSLDVTGKPIREGSPHSLELTKTTVSHEAELKQYFDDLKLLANLEQS